MPKTMPISEMPAFTRVVTQSKWASVGAFARDHFENEKARGASILGFDASDGVDKENWGGAAQAIRNAAKQVGRKVRVRWDEKQGTLFAMDDGEFSPRGPRASKPTASKATATKATAASKGRGRR